MYFKPRPCAPPNLSQRKQNDFNGCPQLLCVCVRFVFCSALRGGPPGSEATTSGSGSSSVLSPTGSSTPSESASSQAACVVFTLATTGWFEGMDHAKHVTLRLMHSGQHPDATECYSAYRSGRSGGSGDTTPDLTWTFALRPRSWHALRWSASLASLLLPAPESSQRSPTTTAKVCF